MVAPELLNELHVYTAPAGGVTIDDPYPFGAGEDIDIDPGRRYVLIPIKLMENTRHRIKMGDRLSYAVTGWSHSGPYITLLKAAPVSSNYNFGPHGYGHRANTRTIGYMKREGYRAICSMQHQTSRHGLRPGVSSHQKVEVFFIGEFSILAARFGQMPWTQLNPTRYANGHQEAFAIAVV